MRDKFIGNNAVQRLVLADSEDLDRARAVAEDPSLVTSTRAVDEVTVTVARAVVRAIPKSTSSSVSVLVRGVLAGAVACLDITDAEIGTIICARCKFTVFAEVASIALANATLPIAPALVIALVVSLGSTA